ncbi:MAG: hypothetical protein U1F76_17995 [Candidatus Competibacteraceae bacterium]
MYFTAVLTLSFGLVLLLAGGVAFAADRCGDADLSKLASRIYVAPTGGDSPTCGASAAAPCQSIQQGIDRCNGAGCGVLVRYGRYDLTATIQLKDGVSVYGRCVFDGDVDRNYRSTLLAPAGGQPAFNAANINTPTWLDGFFVRGSDATTPGGASIAMTVSNSAGLTLRWIQLIGGKGADGAPGSRTDGGQGGNGWGPSGDTGGPGGDACGGNAQGGKGGQGADFQQVSSDTCAIWCYCHNNNYPNSRGRDGAASGNIAGGSGKEPAARGAGCDNHTDTAQDGFTGDPGKTGACALQGGTADPDIFGDFSGGHWIPGQGNGGQTGDVGSGGGGGGSGGMAVLPGHDIPGRPGGGGGGGGCGGAGGTGGQQGGASIPLVLVQSAVPRSNSILIPGPGGSGGAGGMGGQGGPGGSGHSGAAGHNLHVYQWAAYDVWQPGAGGTGGDGGYGGAGAGGAGGNGGPSIGIALVGTSPALPNDQGIYAGQPGAGGSKGVGGQNDSTQCKGADGADGVGGGKATWWQYLPEGYASCAQENGTCRFSGTKEVAFGANGRFIYKTATDSINCNDNTFGDPIFGTVKACYISK